MVGNWQELQKAQTETSDAIAEFKTGFSKQMDELTEELAEKVKALDLSADAADSGMAMIQAFIDSAEDMTPDVQEAYAKLGLVAANAMKGVTGKYLPANMPGINYGTVDTHGWISGAYASGTESAAPGLALVGEHGPELVMMQGGEKVLTAEETKEYLREVALLKTIIPGYAQGTGSTEPGLVAAGGMSAQEVRYLEEEIVLLRMIVPELIAISAYVRGLSFIAPSPAAGVEGQTAALQPMTTVWNARPVEAEEAISDPPGSGGSGGKEYHIQFSPEYHISGNSTPAEVEAVLREHDNSLREQLEELLRDIEADRARSAYK